MNQVYYERTVRPEGSVIDRDDYLVVAKKVSLRHRILLSPFVKYVVPTLFAVTCLMTAVYLTLYFVLNNAKDIWISTCDIRASYRVDCFPGRLNVTYDECNEADCCWIDENEFCFHSVPSRHGYTQKSNAHSYQENEILIPRRSTSPFGTKNVESLSLSVVKHSDPNHIEIVMKIGQAKSRNKRNINEKRRTFVNSFTNEESSTRLRSRDVLSEKLLDFLPKNDARRTVNLQTDSQSNMDVYVHTPEFSITVTRKNDTTRSLLSTARGPLIMTEKFWQITLYITNSTIYGLNQLELNGTINWFYDNENGTSRLAFLGINDNGEATSCYVNHQGPMEIEVMNESNLIVMSGLSLPSEISINVFSGPTPLEAIQQLTKTLDADHVQQNDDIELTSLGLHVCPNDDSSEFIESLSTLIAAMQDNDAPWDSHCIHQTFDSTLGNLMDTEKRSIVDEAMKLLAKDERTLAPHLSPMLYDNELYTKLASHSLLLLNSSVSYKGLYKKRNVFYPDWHDEKTHNESLTYLNDYVKNFGNCKLLYLRDSWPRDESAGHPVPDYSKFDYVPRVLQSLMTNGTVPYTLISSARRKSHYTEHSTYSMDFRNFARAIRASTSLMIRGLWGESGNSSWSAMREEIRAGVGSGIVGQLPSPMYACGTAEKLATVDNNDELCSRWYGAAVAWPHVLAIDANLPGGDHLGASSMSYVVKHLRLRSSLVTYANTVLAQYRINGTPVLAPTSVHYPKDLHARNRWNQFMWGHDILVGLVTLPKVRQALMWIPGIHPWRHLNGGTEVSPTKEGMTSIVAVESQIITLIRPGSIIPIHEKISKTSALTIKNELTLFTNLACVESICNANGTIFYGTQVSDGEFLSLSVNKKTLKIGNISRVKAKACNPDETMILQQATRITKVYVPITDVDYRAYNVNTDFCNINEETHEITFE